MHGTGNTGLMQSKLISPKIIKNWHLFNRNFLWRSSTDPYNILVAEFMLQRTKASQVEPVYKKLLKQYPTVFHLSRAKTKSIIKYTSKLGLHWRYKHFLESSKYIVKNFNGKFPETQNELLKIPGVGAYVAGAICAVCFNSADYVIDSNIARIINRYYGLGLSGEIRRKKIIIEKAKRIFKNKNQRDLLFAILDFTALVCKPIKPVCKTCILRKECKFSEKTNF